MEIIFSWFRRHLSDPQVVALVLIMLACFLGLLLFGKMLLPVLASLVIAYLLDGIAQFLERRRLPRLAAMLLVYLSFLALFVVFTLTLIPLVSREISEALDELPRMISTVQGDLNTLPDKYPNLIGDAESFRRGIASMQQSIQESVTTDFGANAREIVAFSLSSFRNIIIAFVYLVLVPTLVFFMLKDKRKIQRWFAGFLPRERHLANEIWRDFDRQIGNYIRGKAWEIFIVGGVTYATLTLFGLNFSLLLSILVGLSVIVPYVGATVVTFPIAIVAYGQWGLGSDFAWLMTAYLIIQALDGNVLVPLLFSEVVSLHPVAIISAILIFGGIWGAWGVFFAIPLATLVQAILKAWPRQLHRGGAEGGEPEAADAA